MLSSGVILALGGTLLLAVADNVNRVPPGAAS